MSSILTRSVVAVATLTISAAALAATPATAATPSGVTRDTVLTAINGERAADETDTGYSEDTQRAVNKIARLSCNVDPDAGEVVNWAGLQASDAGGSADGAILFAYVGTANTWMTRPCILGIVATTDPAFSLSGTANLSGTVVQQTNDPIILSDVSASAVESLSGNVFVTAPLAQLPDNSYYSDISFVTSGNATRTVAVESTSDVPDQKSAAEKAAAKKTYDKRIKSAKKAYAKALDKADTKAEKSAAKKAYKARRAAAKAQFQYDVATFKTVTKSSTRVENRPFSLKVVSVD